MWIMNQSIIIYKNIHHLKICLVCWDFSFMNDSQRKLHNHHFFKQQAHESLNLLHSPFSFCSKPSPLVGPCTSILISPSLYSKSFCSLPFCPLAFSGYPVKGVFWHDHNPCFPPLLITVETWLHSGKPLLWVSTRHASHSSSKDCSAIVGEPLLLTFPTTIHQSSLHSHAHFSCPFSTGSNVSSNPNFCHHQHPEPWPL